MGKGEKLSFFAVLIKMSFYRFNQVTGRIASSVQKVAYNPAGLQAKLVESAPAEFSSATVVAAPVAEPVVSAEGTVATFENSRGMHPVDADYKRKIIDVQTEWAKTPPVRMAEARRN